MRHCLFHLSFTSIFLRLLGLFMVNIDHIDLFRVDINHIDHYLGKTFSYCKSYYFSKLRNS